MKRGLEGGDEVIMGWKKERSKEGRNEKNNGTQTQNRRPSCLPTLSFYLFYLSSYSSPFSIKIQSDFSYMLTF